MSLPPAPDAPVRPPNRRPAGRLRRLGEWCARHALTVLVLWLAGLAAVQVLQHTSGGTYADDLTLPGTPSAQGRAVLAAHEPTAAGPAGTVVLRADRPLTAYRDQLTAAARALRRLPDVRAVRDPLTPPGPPSQPQPGGTAPVTGPLSADGRTGYLALRFRTPPTALGPDVLAGADHAVAPLRAAGVRVEYGGALGDAARPGGGRLGRALALAAAALVLLAWPLGILAAGLPLLAALIGVVCGLGCLGLLAAAFPLPAVSPALAAMTGLAVGTDAALLLLVRHRRLLRDGAEPAVAAGRAAATAGRAVLVCGGAVLLAAAGLALAGPGYVTGLGAALALTALTAVLAALTLVPALLGLLGRRYGGGGAEVPAAAEAPTGTGTPGPGPQARRAWWAAAAAGALVAVVLAVPACALRPGHLDAGTDPPSATGRRAHDLMAAAFGPGANGPLTLVIDRAAVPQADRPALADQAREVLARIPGAAAVTPLRVSPDGAVLTATAYPARDPQHPATTALLHRLTGSVLPRAVSGYEAHTYVTGATATAAEFRDLVAARLPLLLAAGAGLAFLVLLPVLRGVPAAAVTAVAGLLPVAASYGVVVALFQWGWGGPALGLPGPVPVETWVPVVLCAVLLGTGTARAAVRAARPRTGRPAATEPWRPARALTWAALAMAAVFAAFAASDRTAVRTAAVGLAAGVLTDALLVRPLLLPAALALLGPRAHWRPWWLDHLLPTRAPRDEPARADRPEGPPPEPPERPNPPGSPDSPRPPGPPQPAQPLAGTGPPGA
ncbi:MMPL family transporter [Streptomyces sp. NRRL F-4489]|uniref:MMPL family transporter n=1 Tax=Streptomyces sp. NRRL F-4489 TaxID=1609095 RepID=UPI0008341844|nr:MMPL family transporter [Streptomyces sp. NRRL F-4489]